MKNKNMILILILLLTVGFASVSTSIAMNGSIGISHKKSDFNVIFKTATVTGNTAAVATISDNKRTITFETDKLSTVGDSAELVYKVKNDSTQYDANVSVSCTGGNLGYTNVVSEFAGKTLPLTAPELMGAQEVRMGKISVSLTKAYDASVTKIPITCTLVIEGEERDSIVERSVCEYANGTVWTFDYTGSEQKFKIPCDGEYKLETWGAQGGNYYATGGYGGYASGIARLQKGNDSYAYIAVGGQGSGHTGGYNGGGDGGAAPNVEVYNGSGGGATHIATASGVLSVLSNNQSAVLIVAGGGGGGSKYYKTLIGGNGGGFIGGNPYYNVWGNNGVYKSGNIGSGQTPNEPANNVDSYTSPIGIGRGTFGQGSKSGGGGYYGGNYYSAGSRVYSGSGGSGYIGNQLLTNKAMYCYNCATSNDVATKTISISCTSQNPTANCSKQGNGYARITLIESN